MQARVIEIDTPADADSDTVYEAYLAKLKRSGRAWIDLTNARAIRMCVEASRLGVERFAQLLSEWLDDPTITARRLARWMDGSARPGPTEQRAIYLIAKPRLGGRVSAYLGRLAAFALVTLPVLQLPDLLDQLT